MAESDQKQARTWAMLCHLTALSGFLGVPLGHLLGPLIVWLIKKDEFPLVDEHGKESLNFQLSMTIYLILSGILVLVVVGFVLVVAWLIAEIVLVIIASIKTNNGEPYRYPMTIRFLT